MHFLGIKSHRSRLPHALRAGVESRSEVVKSRELFQAAAGRLGLKATGLDYVTEHIMLCYHVFCLFYSLLTNT